MAKQSDFNSFLKDIEPSTTTVSYISSIQTNLRDYLKSHESYKFVHTDTFLSGSYAKHTSIRPVAGDKKRGISYGKLDRLIVKARNFDDPGKFYFRPVGKDNTMIFRIHKRLRFL